MITSTETTSLKNFVYSKEYGYDCDDPNIVYWCCCHCRTKNPDFFTNCTCCKKKSCGKCNYPWVD
ncbi:hypothetical protein DASC09_006520 [Saccharomycopsis crataegensis]|uniref:RanBP2-type domain-containing protein n=1 Tax=Saccharomycopsis crataegensis TaxID=43959 RepID=A0AAV5QF08_9ASCO|nr:hypothetical protein DASC09_006520 [Saccharomycopsis crataegensis]